MRRFQKFSLMLAAVSITLPALSCGGSSSPSEPSGPKTVTVMVQDDAFSPHSVTINPGDTVHWVLQGSLLTHTVTDSGGAFDSGAVFTAPGASFDQKFNQANVTYSYACKVHGACCAMKGSILVGSAAPPPTPGYR